MSRILLLLLSLIPMSLYAQPTLEQRLDIASASRADALNSITELLDKPVSQLAYEDLLVLAEAYLAIDNKEGAVDTINRTLSAAHTPVNKARALLLKARIYGILYRDTSLAVTQLEEASQLLSTEVEDITARKLLTDILQNYAQAHNQQGNMTLAMSYAEQSLALSLTLADPAREMKARVITGRIALQNNVYSSAFRHFQRALVLASHLNDTTTLASIHFRLGMAYRKMEEHELALEHLLEAKSRYQQLGNTSSYLYTLLYIAESYLEDAKTAEEAASYFAEANELARANNDLLRIGLVQGGLGRLAVLQHDPGTARRHFSEAIQIFRQLNQKTSLTEIILALAELLFQQQQFQDADALLAELPEDLSNHTVYLQFRYAELVARVAAHKQQWQKAYLMEKTARELRFQFMAEQHKTRFDLLKGTLEQLADTEEAQQELAEQNNELQHQNTLHRLIVVALVFLTITLSAVLVTLFILWKRSRNPQSPAHPLSGNWQHFCETSQQLQKNTTSLHLLAFALRGQQPLRQKLGEQNLRRILAATLPALSCPEIKSSCINSDILWLMLETTDAGIAALQQRLQEQVLKNMQPHLPDLKLVSISLPVSVLLGTRWSAQELTALREIVWLSWHLVARNTSAPAEHHWQISITSQQSHPCSWHSEALRQDLLNALSLGMLTLHYNQQPVELDITELPE